MTTPTIRTAMTSDDILPGPFSEDDLRQQWNAQADEFNQWDSLETYEQLAWAQARAIGADRYARAALQAEPEGEVSPPGYIDPEHVGENRELLETFYRATNAEGGTADEIHLRGIRAVLARWGTPATTPTPVPLSGYLQSYDAGRRDAVADEQQAADAAQDPPAPEPGEVAELVAFLTPSREQAGVISLEAFTKLTRAATVLQQQATELAALRGVPVAAEALARLYWWGGMRPDYGYDSGVVLGVRDWINGGMVGGLPPLPAWIADRCPPLPAPQAGEVQP